MNEQNNKKTVQEETPKTTQEYRQLSPLHGEKQCPNVGFSRQSTSQQQALY